ncbi:Heat shock protein. Metallo peptidase. MEROPS family M48B [Desulfatibacillum alkenivorans DSM 16219]|jgi:heat shock protein HtpX|uniref:Protease HtpX homolog n=1 Tax=Desulfatibacillum alkenivorans DSM 16219 TaxID=1121393 RepID=A0A1M6I8Y5_9BACT|nr:zinc metalloprotease HtpX [Desulfatibacillum alkenivorans]SHJ30826.1 Heat shock protein. Metallo peptidase. MEROPS family M48B [Desulfatibacillum alkenivorans DSM 16219]
MGNQIKSVMLLTAMTAFLLIVGQLIGGRAGMTFALIMAVGMNFFSYWYSDKIVLKMYRAKEVGPGQASELYGIVQRLSSNAGLPMPKVYIIPQQAPNAFATGRNPEHAVVAVTEGLLNLMNREELAGVLAHELAHVKNRDILIGTIAATMAGAVMFLASMAKWGAIFGGFGGRDDDSPLGFAGMLIMAILAPIGAALIQMTISRTREYQADATGAQIAGNPKGLANALAKLGAYSGRIPMDAEPATAHMFIVNPLSGKSLASLFSTHPPLEERIARLTGAMPQGGAPSPPNRTARNAEDSARDFWDSLK